ncbi:MAG: glycosyltransferase [Armatimonadetes bacterium]|nr:glycosyltransferase [Armatimonadota bacterium]
MRLAYLTAVWPSPSETFLAREVDGLRAAGIDLRVFALRPGNGHRDPLACYAPSLVAHGRRPDSWHPILRRRPELARITAGCRSAAQLRHITTALWLAEQMVDQGCDALHAAWANLPADLAWMAHQLGGPAYTVAGHAFDVFVTSQVRDAAWHEARGFVTCNRVAWRTLASRLGPGCVTWLPHGLPLAQWPQRESCPAPPLVLGVGRLVPKKGFDTLVRALAMLNPRPRLVVLGDGPERARLLALAADLGVGLELPGQIPPEHVRGWLAQASALALPSRVTASGDRDGLANVILEAMATGVPVMSTPAGSAEDAIAHGQTGLLVPPGDPAALAEALSRVLADGVLAAGLVAKARARVEHRFDLEVNTARLARWLVSMHGRSVDGLGSLNGGRTSGPSGDTG